MSKEIENYIDMMRHTLNRRMDSQPGRQELIDEYTEKMQKGMEALERLDQIVSTDSSEAMELFEELIEHLLPNYNNPKHHYNLWTTSRIENIKNFILKSLAKEQELAQLKDIIKLYEEYMDLSLSKCKTSSFSFYIAKDNERHTELEDILFFKMQRSK